MKHSPTTYNVCITNANDKHIRVLGGHRSTSRGSQLPFTHLQMWKKFHLQNKAYHYPYETFPSKTINVCPPSGKWELGCYDSVIVNLDPVCEWPHSGLEGLDILDFGSLVEYPANLQYQGHQVMELCLIFHIIQCTRSILLV